MKNRCDEALDRLQTRLEKPGFSKKEFQSFLNVHVDCSEVLQENFDLWNDLKDLSIPEPTPQMSINFYKSLTEEANKGKTRSIPTQTIGLSFRKWWPAVAAVFIIGIIGGNYFLNDNKAGPDLSSSNVDPQHNAQFVSYDPSFSTSNRLEGIQNIGDLLVADERIFKALNQALLTDPNINVRISAIESMLHFADNPKIREFLILAIPQQESASVQIALADAMLFLQERRSKNAFDKLLDSEDVDKDVKLHILESLREIY